MKAVVLGSLGLVSLVLAQAVSAADDKLCSRLNAWEDQSLASDRSTSRSIEIYWNYDQDSIFSIACKRGDDAPSKALCGWITGHVSMEFAGLLIKRVRACYRRESDVASATQFVAATFSSKTRRLGRLVMQTNWVAPDDIPWMRLTVVPKGVIFDDVRLQRPVPFSDAPD